MSIVVFFGARASFWPRSYSTDGTIADEEHDEVWQVSKARLQYWPRLYERHIHQVQPRASDGACNLITLAYHSSVLHQFSCVCLAKRIG